MIVRFHLQAMLPPRTPRAAAVAQDIWTHSLVVSSIAGVLAPRVGDIDQGFASTLGLLHDIGRLAICSQHPDFAAALRAVPRDEKSLLEREAAAFGADHASAGAILGNRWQLPADLNTAIRWHHHPEKAFEPTDPPPLRRAVYLVHIADQLAKYCFAYSEDMEIETVSAETLKMLGLGESLEQLLDAKVRTAATQAILFTEEAGKGSNWIVRPFIKLRRDTEAGEICDRLRKSGVPPIPTGTAGNELIDSCREPHSFDAANLRIPKMREEGRGRFTFPTTSVGLEWVAKVLPPHWQVAAVTPRVAACAGTALRALLPNLLAEQNIAVDVAWRWEAKVLHVAVRSLAMEFAARMPMADLQLSGQLLAAELASLTNLGWFDFESSADGATLLLRSR
jgi:putative nucleotidyltransferase with HDIG domain